MALACPETRNATENHSFCFFSPSGGLRSYRPIAGATWDPRYVFGWYDVESEVAVSQTTGWLLSLAKGGATSSAMPIECNQDGQS